MEVPNNIITDKDLLYFKDALKWNLTACKKAKTYKQKSKDASVKSYFDSVSKMHKEHFKTILGLLK